MHLVVNYLQERVPQQLPMLLYNTCIELIEDDHILNCH